MQKSQNHLPGSRYFPVIIVHVLQVLQRRPHVPHVHVRGGLDHAAPEVGHDGQAHDEDRGQPGERQRPKLGLH